jgi:sugar phosphate isomerase/epimerase
VFLAYCTNIHPAETWPETLAALKTHVLAVRDLLLASGVQSPELPYPIGLRLSAIAASELLQNDNLQNFKNWLASNNCSVFTINGFPYGSFHGTRVKDKVFLPDWTSPDRISYTKNLFKIIAEIAPKHTGGSVSTLPGSHKSFSADETLIRQNLIEIASFIEDLSQQHQIDLHLGLEPEPLGHFENTAESIAFFQRLNSSPNRPSFLSNRIGINFDSCHFAIEFDNATHALDSLHQNNIRLSKIHLSNALSLNPNNPDAIEAIRRFDEPTYFHQVIAQSQNGSLERFIDLPVFLNAIDQKTITPSDFTEARVHFHIPLDTEPSPPLKSTSFHVEETLAWCKKHPTACQHFEIETYTWAVLPQNLQRPVEYQIAAEYDWVLDKLKS